MNYPDGLTATDYAHIEGAPGCSHEMVSIHVEDESSYDDAVDGNSGALVFVECGVCGQAWDQRLPRLTYLSEQPRRIA